jgi:SET domain-containing protein
MIHVKYKLNKSRQHGIGFFADENISKGRLIYTASPLLDVDITQEEFDLLEAAEKAEIKYWGFWDEINNVWHVDFDVSKFINHSFQATLTQDESHPEAYLVATRNIKKDEELTQNYLEFETEEDLKARGIDVTNKN